jgi:hypothetical protein
MLDTPIYASILEIKQAISANIFFKDDVSSLFDSKPVGNSIMALCILPVTGQIPSLLLQQAFPFQLL